MGAVEAQVEIVAVQALSHEFAKQAFELAGRNPSGLLRELWYHGSGCRSWLVVTRNTYTHEIRNVSSARDVALTRLTGDAA